MICYLEDAEEVHDGATMKSVYPNYSSGSDAGSPEEPIYMPRSYFLLPEAFDNEDVLYAAIEDIHDSDAIWLPDDFPEEGEISEDIFIAVLANYGQVRKFLHTKALARGF